MPLYLVEKYAQDKKDRIKVAKKLHEDDEKALYSHYFLREKSFRKKVLDFAQEVYDTKNLWLQCRCKFVDNEYPIMGFKKSPKGEALILFHIHKRGAHDEACPFVKEIPDYEESDGPDLVTGRKAETKPIGPLNLLATNARALGEASQSIEKQSGNRIKIRKQSKLCKTLYRLLDDAHCNKVGVNTTQKPFAMLSDVLKKINLVGDRVLSDYFYFDIDRLKNASIRLEYDKSWPKKFTKHCLFLVNVVRIEEKRVIVLNRNMNEIPVDITNKIYHQSGHFGERTKPYLCLILVRKVEKGSNNDYAPYNAFVVPRYSNDSLFPVDSFYEREMLRYLYPLYFSMDKQGMKFIIEKPLFEIEVEGGELPVLPDFLLKAANKTIVVEVNGSTEPEYLVRKERTQATMAKIGPLFVFNAAEFELQKKLEEEFKAFIGQLREAICLAFNP